MSRLDNEPDILSLAHALGVDWRISPVRAVLEYCQNRVQEICAHTSIESLAHLQDLICQELRLVFEEFTTDRELHDIGRRYARDGDPAFIAATDAWCDDVFATLLERRNATANSKDRYVALIDCRGDKAQRRFFTKWHEIAHLLTLVDQLQLPFHRSTDGREPIEQLMDRIAGEIGFYEPMVRPVVERRLATSKRLTFEVIDQIRSELCIDASFHSTLIAISRLAQLPVVVVEAGYGLKKSEQRQLASRQIELFPTPKPKPRLRAVVTTSNEAARTVGFGIHRNMAIPDESVIAQCFVDTEGLGCGDTSGRECLSLWIHTDGSTLGKGSIMVQARRIRDRVVAIISPL